MTYNSSGLLTFNSLTTNLRVVSRSTLVSYSDKTIPCHQVDPTINQAISKFILYLNKLYFKSEIVILTHRHRVLLCT